MEGGNERRGGREEMRGEEGGRMRKRGIQGRGGREKKRGRKGVYIVG